MSFLTTILILAVYSQGIFTMAAQKCLLNSEYSWLLNDTKMGLSQVKKIEAHVTSTKNSCCSLSLSDVLFKGDLEGTTPLVLACHYGDLESVKQHIVECWGLDVNIPAVYYSKLYKYDIKINRATPLIAASFRYHAHVVRYLVEKGADVSAKTAIDPYNEEHQREYDGLTPLYGAFSADKIRNESVENEKKNDTILFLLESGSDPNVTRPSDGSPIWHLGDFDADVTIALVNHGMSLDLRSKGNSTSLHFLTDADFSGYHRAGRNATKIVAIKHVVDKKPDLMNDRDIDGFTPILEAAGGKVHDNCPNLVLLDFFLEREDLGRKEKINAMELVGWIRNNFWRF